MPKKSQIIPIKPENDIPIVDCHAHFPDKEPRRTPTHSYESQYQYFFEEHNGQFIISSASLWDYEFIQNFIDTHDNIYLTMGCGLPSDRYSSPGEKERQNEHIKFWKDNPEKYVAIGEFGLDFHHAKSFEKREEQVELFKRIISETKHLKKPYVLHVRNPTERDVNPGCAKPEYNERDICNRIIEETLESENIPPEEVMWHCFSGPAEYGPVLAKKGYYISVPSSAYGFNRWRRNIPNVPITQLLTETDSHYQHPFKMGAFNTPANVKYAVAAIAYVNNKKQKEVANQILINAKKFFRIE